MKILVTGGAGFIASHIVDAYVAAKHTVAIVDNLHHGFKKNLNPKAKFYQVDIRNLSKLRKIFQTFKPVIVNHHAAISEVVTSMRDPLTTLDVNVTGTANVLACMAEVQSKKIIFASTGGTIYGDAKRLPSRETDPLLPISAYAASKQLGENWIQYYQRAYGIDFTIFRYGNVFGVRQDPYGEAGVVAIFAQQLHRHKPTYLFGQGDKQRDYIYIPDVVQANQLALQKGSNQILNLGYGKAITDQMVFQTVAKHFGVVQPPQRRAVRAGEVMYTYLAAKQAKQMLGWQPQWSFTAGVSDYVKEMGYV